MYRFLQRLRAEKRRKVKRRHRKVAPFRFPPLGVAG
jgi:hypothetical protein